MNNLEALVEYYKGGSTSGLIRHRKMLEELLASLPGALPLSPTVVADTKTAIEAMSIVIQLRDNKE